MLPAHMEEDKAKLRTVYEVREAIDIMKQLVGDNVPYFTEWPIMHGYTYFIMKSGYSKKLHDVVLPIDIKKFIIRYSRWVNGEHIQDVFPMFDPDIREFIKTGITPTEWNELFPEEVDD